VKADQLFEQVTADLIAAIEAGKPLLMLPRLQAEGEHNTDHQLATARDVGSRPGLHVADSAADLQVRASALLADSGYAQVVIRVRPDDAPPVAAQLIALRDEYERTFAQAIRALPLPPGTDRGVLKLMLLGALNWSQSWYRPGRDSPQMLARRFVRLLRDPQAV